MADSDPKDFAAEVSDLAKQRREVGFQEVPPPGADLEQDVNHCQRCGTVVPDFRARFCYSCEIALWGDE